VKRPDPWGTARAVTTLVARLRSRLGSTGRSAAAAPPPDALVREATGLVPIANVDERDVFVVGYPKSGNTWVQNLLAAAVWGVDASRAPDRLIQDLVPDIHHRRYYRRYGTPMLFKSHDLPRPEYRRVIYLVRDGRDVMVSYFHHLRAIRGAGVTYTGMLEDRSLMFPCPWEDHVEAWLANPFAARMLVIRYEDLLEDCAAQLARACRFIGIDCAPHSLAGSVEKASFARLQQKERQQGWDLESWPREATFIRRGKAGSYRDELPSEILDVLEGRAGATLRRCGYS
jgi:sulfotransferase family protein